MWFWHPGCYWASAEKKETTEETKPEVFTFCLLYFSWTGVDIEVDIPTVKVKYLHYNRSCIIQYVTRLRTSVRTSSASKPIVSSTSLAARLKKKQKSSALSAKVRVTFKQLSIVDLVILIITVFIHHNPHHPSEWESPWSSGDLLSRKLFKRYYQGSSRQARSRSF